MIEGGRRTVTDRGTLTHIAQALAIPPHMLGIASPDDADFAAMLAFGSSRSVQLSAAGCLGSRWRDCQRVRRLAASSMGGR